ncbi:hypothetical protein Tco_0008765 [Tanacetum coccineum]
MSTHEQITNNPTSAVRSTGGRNGPQGLEEPMSDEVLREICDKNYHQLLPLMRKDARKVSRKTTQPRESRRCFPEAITTRSVFKRLKKYRSPSPRLRPRKEGGVFNRLGRKEPATSARPDSRQRSPQAKRTEVEARRRQQKGTSLGDPEVHLKLISDGDKNRRFGYMRPWCHMFNSTLTGNARVWFDKLPKESIDSYRRSKESLGKNFLQQTKNIKDPGGDTSHQQEKGEVAALSHGQRKASSSWITVRRGNKTNFKKRLPKTNKEPDRKPG